MWFSILIFNDANNIWCRLSQRDDTIIPYTIEGKPHYEIYQPEILSKNKNENERRKDKALSDSKENEKMEVASDSITSTPIVEIKEGDISRKVNFPVNEKKKKKEIIEIDGKTNENNSEGVQNAIKNKIVKKDCIIPFSKSGNEKISSYPSAFQETKMILEKNKKVNEKVFLAFEKQEFPELASEILQNTFQNLFSEVMCGEFLLQLPSLESSS